MIEKRVLAGIEVVKALEQQRRHPVAIVGVERLRHFEKSNEGAAIVYPLDVKRGAAATASWACSRAV